MGNAIKTAIGIAFPPVQSIINAIWGNKPNDPKKASDAKTSLNQMQQGALKQVQGVATDLDIVDLYLSDCVEADRHVIAIVSQFARNASLSDADVLNIKQDWNFAEPRIQELGTKDVKDQANKVNDSYIQKTLIAISNANLGELKNIDDALAAKNPALLIKNLSSLEDKLAAVTALAGYIVNQASSGLRDVQKTWAPPQGPDTPEEKKRNAQAAKHAQTYQTVLKGVYGVQ